MEYKKVMFNGEMIEIPDEIEEDEIEKNVEPKHIEKDENHG